MLKVIKKERRIKKKEEGREGKGKETGNRRGGAEGLPEQRAT